MARAFVQAYNGFRIEGAEIIISMPVTYAANNGDQFGPTVDVRVPLSATPQQIRSAILAQVVIDGMSFGVTIGQNETILFGYDKG